jgi:hypothetical protein
VDGCRLDAPCPERGANWGRWYALGSASDPLGPNRPAPVTRNSRTVRPDLPFFIYENVRSERVKGHGGKVSLGQRLEARDQWRHVGC